LLLGLLACHNHSILKYSLWELLDRKTPAEQSGLANLQLPTDATLPLPLGQSKGNMGQGQIQKTGQFTEQNKPHAVPEWVN